MIELIILMEHGKEERVTDCHPRYAISSVEVTPPTCNNRIHFGEVLERDDKSWVQPHPPKWNAVVEKSEDDKVARQSINETEDLYEWQRVHPKVSYSSRRQWEIQPHRRTSSKWSGSVHVHVEVLAWSLRSQWVFPKNGSAVMSKLCLMLFLLEVKKSVGVWKWKWMRKDTKSFSKRSFMWDMK